ncbi:MAG: FAD-dependent oxidoreductase, partial [Mycobacteriaceae bacterium]
MDHFDLAIIGTGSGNSIPGENFTNKRVAILEEGVFGGTCLNVGCIPTKMFVYAADVAQVISDSARFGIDSHISEIRWSDIVSRVFGRIDPIAAGGENYRRTDCENITVFSGHAQFLAPQPNGCSTLDTGAGSAITADQVVIAAGSRPVIPDVITQSGIRFYTNENIMRLPKLPGRLIILGGGYIATEFAHVFSSLGVDICLIARGEKLLRHQDHSIAEKFTELASNTWDVRLNSSISSAESTRDGHIIITLDNGNKITGDTLLVATGRTPNGDLLNANLGGVDIDNNGRVLVDSYQRTSATGVYALGDVSSPYLLKHVANHEA